MIALVDCNNFFCSCELLFRPSLKTMPVVVLSSNDGCAISRNQQAKEIGIQMGQPYFQFKALHQQKKIAIFSANFALYNDLSIRVMNLLKKISSKVEVYSIDEAFLEVSNANDLCHLPETIQQYIGIPVSVAVASTKVLAKAAMLKAKKEGFYTLNPQHEQQYLKTVALQELWGIGRAHFQRFHNLGLKTAYDFAHYQSTHLEMPLRQMQEELNGKICFELQTSPTHKKQIQSSRSLEYPLQDLGQMKQQVAQHITRCSERLRRQDSVTERVEIAAMGSRFDYPRIANIYLEVNLSHPSCDTLHILDECLSQIEKKFILAPYKKVSVRFCKITPRYQQQLTFWQGEDPIERLQLMQQMDNLNQRYGPQTLQSAACPLKKQKLAFSRKYLSARYTTHWDELAQFGDYQCSRK